MWKKDDFWELKGPDGKLYRVVPEDILEEVLRRPLRIELPALDSKKPIGEQIRQMREGANLSQPELAKLAEITQPQLSRIEMGRVKQPHRTTLDRLLHEIAKAHARQRTI